MKFHLTFKDPNACSDIDGLNDNVDEVKETIRKFIRYDELVTIEFDTNSKTAIVITNETRE